MKTNLLVLLFCSISLLTLAQNPVKIEDVRRREFKGLDEIFDHQSGQLVGYYTYYINEKGKNGVNSFFIDIYDIDLKLTKRNAIVLEKYTVLTDAEFNGSEFLFVFNEIYGANRLTKFYTFNTKGEQIAYSQKELDRKNPDGGNVLSAGEGFFYIVRQYKEKKWGYEVMLIDKNHQQVWKKTSFPPRAILFLN